MDEQKPESVELPDYYLQLVDEYLYNHWQSVLQADEVHPRYSGTGIVVHKGNIKIRSVEPFTLIEFAAIARLAGVTEIPDGVTKLVSEPVYVDIKPRGAKTVRPYKVKKAA